jgi:oligoendopeptidase F
LGEIPKLKALKGTLGQSAASLRSGLQYISDIGRATARMDVYANLKADLDTRNTADLARRGAVQNLETQIGEATAWVSPEVLTIGAAKIAAFEAAEPGLGKFRFPLEMILRAAPHTLSDEGESVLAAAGDALQGPVNVYTQLTDSDIPWPSVTLSTGLVKLDDAGYELNREAPNRADRKLAMTTFFGAYKTFESSLGATLASQISGDIFTAKSRHYDNALQAAVFPNGVEESVYRTLVAECNAGLPQLHRYFKLRQKLLGLPDLAYWDIYPPVVKLDRTFDLATKRRLTLEAVKPLGEAYGALLAKATAAKWMDSQPRPGKVSGAYENGGAYDVHP